MDIVHAAGAYVCRWSGHLVRVPAPSPAAAHPVAFNLIVREPLITTKISDDPCVSVRQARRLAAQLALEVNFQRTDTRYS